MRVILLVLFLAWISIIAVYPKESYAPEEIFSMIYREIPDSYYYSTGNSIGCGLIQFYSSRRTRKIRAEIFYVNDTNKSIDFDGAKYYMTSYSGTTYILDFDTVSHNEGGGHSTILKPGKTISIFCYSPIDPQGEIKRIYIKLKDSTVVIFNAEKEFLTQNEFDYNKKGGLTE